MESRNFSNQESGASSSQTAGVTSGRVWSGLTRPTSSEIPQMKFRIATLNVGTMRGRSGEVVETMSRRHIDICSLQETRWKGGSARKLTGKDSVYKFLWSGNNQGTAGVGFLLAEKWINSVFEVRRVSDRIMYSRDSLSRSTVVAASLTWLESLTWLLRPNV